jgi:hypothetical protein
VRLLVALATVAMLLGGVASPHHHGAAGGVHECVACTVGAGLEARDATPDLSPPASHAVAVVLPPGEDPVTGAPLGAIPGQSPPA